MTLQRFFVESHVKQCDIVPSISETRPQLLSHLRNDATWLHWICLIVLGSGQEKIHLQLGRFGDVFGILPPKTKAFVESGGVRVSLHISNVRHVC